VKSGRSNLRNVLITATALTLVITPLFSLSCDSDRSSQISTDTIRPASPAAVETPNRTYTPQTSPGLVPLSPVEVQYRPPPSYAPEPESFVPEADTVVTGQVLESPPQFQLGKNIYRDWIIKIESYIVHPLPPDNLKVRIWESTQSGNLNMTVKGVHLRQGERLLLFLKAEDDHFIFAGGLMGAKFTIDGDSVIYSLIGNSYWPLTDVMSRIRTVNDTWADEKFTAERRSQIENMVLGDQGIQEFLAGKDFEIGQVTPYVKEEALTDLYYMLSIYVPKQNSYDVLLVVQVNATRKKVDQIIVHAGNMAYSDEVEYNIRQIALSDPVVKGLIGERSYKIAGITRDSWQDNIGNKAVINIFPKVEIWLQPVISNILNVFVDEKGEKVVKIYNESHLSPSPLESHITDRDFTLSVSIPKTNYQVGEIAEAVLTLTYNGAQPVELNSTGGQYFDLLTRDGQNNTAYQWERYQAGLPANLPAPADPVQPAPPLTAMPERPYKETLHPGQSITGRLQFSLPEAGTYYLRGRNFGGWDFGDIMAIYPDGSGYGLYIEAPFIVIEVH
jgi:hypothetical protein